MFLMELTQTVSDSGGDDDTALTFTRFSHLVTIPHLFAALCVYICIFDFSTFNCNRIFHVLFF